MLLQDLDSENLKLFFHNLDRYIDKVAPKKYCV